MALLLAAASLALAGCDNCKDGDEFSPRSGVYKVCQDGTWVEVDTN